LGNRRSNDSKIVDQQAAIDDAIQIVIGALSGAHLIHDVGFIDLGPELDLWSRWFYAMK